MGSSHSNASKNYKTQLRSLNERTSSVHDLYLLYIQTLNLGEKDGNLQLKLVYALQDLIKFMHYELNAYFLPASPSNGMNSVYLEEQNILKEFCNKFSLKVQMIKGFDLNQSVQERFNHAFLLRKSDDLKDFKEFLEQKFNSTRASSAKPGTFNFLKHGMILFYY